MLWSAEGPLGTWYETEGGPLALWRAWADRVAGWAREGLPVWAYFNNDAAAHAIRDADRLRSYVVSRLQA